MTGVDLIVGVTPAAQSRTAENLENGRDRIADALADGEISEDEAEVIADPADRNPAAEQELLDTASNEDRPHEDLQDRAADDTGIDLTAIDTIEAFDQLVLIETTRAPRTASAVRAVGHARLSGGPAPSRPDGARLTAVGRPEFLDLHDEQCHAGRGRLASTHLEEQLEHGRAEDGHQQ